MVSNTNKKIVEAVGLTKVFKDFWMRTKAVAVQDVDFDIFPDEIFGLLGPNGSGKSTTIKMILGLLHKTRGRLLVFGRDPHDVSVKKHIGFLPEESYLYQFLNARETLDYYGKLFGLDYRTRRRRTDELLDMIGLTNVAHRPVGEFSKGMMRRIGLAQALINDPEFLILDEPTAGLDPIGTRQVKDMILELGRRGKTILLSSHLLADVEDVCDRMVILYGGKIRAQGTADDLLLDSQRTVLEAPRLSIDTIAAIKAMIREREGKDIERVEAPRQRLEQLFLDIVEQARREQVTTSGAVHDGQTAAFLRGEAASGEALIDSLMRDEQPASATPAQPAESHAQQREQVLGQLLDDEQPAEMTATPRHEKSADEHEQDVDESVIESLVGNDDAQPDADSQANQSPRRDS